MKRTYDETFGNRLVKCTHHEDLKTFGEVFLRAIDLEDMDAYQKSVFRFGQILGRHPQHHPIWEGETKDDGHPHGPNYELCRRALHHAVYFLSFGPGFKNYPGDEKARRLEPKIDKRLADLDLPGVSNLKTILEIAKLVCLATYSRDADDQKDVGLRINRRIENSELIAS